MAFSDSGRIPLRVIVIQVLIVAGLFVFIKLYLPHKEKADAAAALQARENRIENFFQSVTGEDSGGSQTLRSTPSVQEVEQSLGAPDTSTTDYAGGLHLTWIGARHSLVGSFNRGRLYSLTLTTPATGQAVTVSASSADL